MIDYRAYLDALLSLPAFEWADDEWRMWQSLYRAACAQVARVPMTYQGFSPPQAAPL